MSADGDLLPRGGATAAIILEKLTKRYPNDFEAVHELSLEVGAGEFMVLVGPSGCGKTTALRMVAGLEDITSGTLSIDGRVVNEVSSKDRNVAMVFQNYALYPHMTVADNIGFALKLRKRPKREIKRRVDEAAEILGLTESLARRPAQLSGGQRQRVAMGRAIIREPSVFLMDEPLSNLDAKLRVQMRAEVRRIQRRLGVATLYVTHDQTEAMTMGDRVAVIQSGLLLQCDRPGVLYDRPVGMFVAAFIGSPAMNLYEGALSEGANALSIGSQVIQLPDAVRARRPELRSYANRRVVVGIRPEDLSVVEDPSGARLVADVELVESLGSELLVHFSLDANRVRVDQVSEDGVGPLEGGGELSLSNEGIARVDPRAPVSSGDRVHFKFDAERLHFFDPQDEHAIWE
jgi:multiple sugar transport system ATP-binding protein